MSSIFEDEKTKEIFIGSMIDTDDEETIEELVEELEENIDFINISNLNRNKGKQLISEIKQETDIIQRQKLFINLKKLVTKDGK